MARIAGVDLPRDKRVEIGLTYIYGIGRASSNRILAEAKVNPDTRCRDLTDDEVKQKVVNYLRKNEFITRSVVQSICGMTRTTATRQIRRLCEENVLVNKGLQKQPIYFLKEKE